MMWMTYGYNSTMFFAPSQNFPSLSISITLLVTKRLNLNTYRNRVAIKISALGSHNAALSIAPSFYEPKQENGSTN